MPKIIKLILPVLILYLFYFLIVDSNLPYLYHKEFFISFNRFKNYIRSNQTNSLIFIGPSTIASAIAPREIYNDSVNLSIYGISPIEVLTIAQKLANNTSPPKCIVFNFTYNRKTYFSSSDPLDVNWPLFQNFYIPKALLDDFLEVYNSIYKDHVELNYLQFYVRYILNALRLDWYHLKLFFSFFEHNPAFSFSSQITNTQKDNEPNENMGLIAKDTQSLNYLSGYNMQYLNKFEINELSDRYFLKIATFAKFKKIRSAFLFTPVSSSLNRANRYNKEIYSHLLDLVQQNHLDDFVQIIFTPQKYKDLNFIDLNHIDNDSAILFSQRIKDNVLSSCGLN